MNLEPTLKYSISKILFLEPNEQIANNNGLVKLLVSQVPEFACLLSMAHKKDVYGFQIANNFASLKNRAYKNRERIENVSSSLDLLKTNPYAQKIFKIGFKV